MVGHLLCTSPKVSNILHPIVPLLASNFAEVPLIGGYLQVATLESSQRIKMRLKSK